MNESLRIVGSGESRRVGARPSRGTKRRADHDGTENQASRGRREPDGFGQFYAEHHQPITRALTLSLGHIELGQDAAAEAFTRALDRWSDVRSFDNPRGWLYRVGLNWARSRRRRRRREVGPDDWSHLREQAQPGDSATAVHNDLVVTEALAQLSFDHRVAVVARFYLDWKEIDLARALDIPLGTVKSRTKRALNQLATILENDT